MARGRQFAPSPATDGTWVSTYKFIVMIVFCLSKISWKIKCWLRQLGICVYRIKHSLRQSRICVSYRISFTKSLFVQILKKSVNIVMTVVIELIVYVCLTVLALYTLLSFNCPSPNPLFISEVLKLREL
jgi:hypothetical protein